MFIGIDPGKKGGIVEISKDGRIIHQYVIPLKDVKSKKRGKKTPDQVVDLEKLCEIINSLRGARVVLEDIHAIFGTDKGTMFKMGRVLGNIEAALTCNGLPFTMVAPKVWQKAIWPPSAVVHIPSSTGKTFVIDTKATSLKVAQAYFPGHDFRYGMNEDNTERRRIALDGLVDAALIALYCRLIHNNV